MKLRTLTIADAPRVAALVGDFELSRWTSSIPHPYSLQDAVSWIETINADESLRRCHAVEVDGELVACVSYWPDETAGIEVGYWVGRAYWGRGIASEALEHMLATDDFPREETVVAKVMVGNIASERVLQKCGLVYAGTCEIPCRDEWVAAKLFVRDPA